MTKKDHRRSKTGPKPSKYITGKAPKFGSTKKQTDAWIKKNKPNVVEEGGAWGPSAKETPQGRSRTDAEKAQRKYKRDLRKASGPTKDEMGQGRKSTAPKGKTADMKTRKDPRKKKSKKGVEA